MGLMIVAESQQQYAAWIQGQRAEAPRPADPVLKQGEQVFLGLACVYCHTIRGTVATGQITLPCSAPSPVHLPLLTPLLSACAA